MCDCIERIEENINYTENAVRATLGSHSSQSSMVGYRPITAKGEPSKHNRYTSVDWEFCPFCGVKILKKE